MDDGHRKQFYIYMTASKPGGVIYVGMTSNLSARAWSGGRGIPAVHAP